MNAIRTIAVLLLACMVSCSRPCHPRLISYVMMQRDTIPDTASLIIKYEKGGNFSKTIDSIYGTISKGPRPGAGAYGVIGYDFSDANKDYIIILLPSGETHKIANIHYGNEKDRGVMDEATLCSFGYTIDGKPDGQGTYQESGNVSTEHGWISL